MKFARILLPLLTLAIGASAPAQAPASSDQRRVDPFERTRTQIEMLLARRINPPAFDASRYNPFTIGPVGGVVITNPDTNEPAPVESAESLLRQLAPRLRVTGYFAREDASYAVIDGVPRREGDFIILSHHGSPVNIRLKRVENSRLVLGLGDAEYILRF